MLYHEYLKKKKRVLHQFLHSNINARCVNVCNNTVETLEKCNVRVLPTSRINPEGLTSVFARGNAGRFFLARKGGRLSRTGFVVVHLGTGQDGIRRRSRVCSLVSFRRCCPPSSSPSTRKYGILLSPSHEVTYRDARCFTTWAKLSHQVVTRTPFPSPILSFATPPLSPRAPSPD